jgi:mono/diheme cytochrome c family protein
MKHLIILAAAIALGGCLIVPGSSHAAPVAAGGKQIFDANCAQCHDATSTETKVGPGLKGLFKSKKLPGTGRPTTVANVTRQIKNGGGGMPAFGGSLSAAEITAVVGYLKTL